MRAKRDLQQEARRLRLEGRSVKEIVVMLGVAKSSVSVWVRDIKLTDEQKTELHQRRGQFGERNHGSRVNREQGLETRLAFQRAGRERARENRPLHLAGCMLYWAEGAKGRNGVYFVNSDPNMIVFFMRFLRDEFHVENDSVAVRIHCHTHDEQEIKRIEKYWCDLLGLPITAVKKTYVKDSNSTRLNRLQNGVCDIRVHRTEIVQHIFGAIQEYAGFDNPAWLF
jgi:predicted transcriptional regulator